MDGNYEMPFRPNFEARATVGWLAGMGGGYLVHAASGLPIVPFEALGAACAVGVAYRGTQALRHHWVRKKLEGFPIETIKHADLEKMMLKAKDNVVLGKGFHWTQRECQLLYDITTRAPTEIDLPENEKLKGARYIHGLGKKEASLIVMRSFLEGHLGIFGTTGAGKTSLFYMLVTQAIRRGEAVVIIDPKGDHDLRENAQRACELMGKLKDFAVLHPAYPSRCIRMDPLKNYNRLTELSSRIAALIPSETGSDPFKSFCQMALNNIVQGMFEVGEVMQLRSIRSYLEGGVDDLTIRAIEKYCDRYVDGWQTMASKFIGQVKRDKPDQYAKRLIDFYWQVVKGIRSSSDIEGLLHHAKHDREHLTKMISSLLPVMGMLTSGELGRLLSPDDSDMDDPRRILDLKTIIRNKMVLYVGLDSLSDPMVASAIGSMFLSDLSAVAGDRYNYVDKSMLEPVNIFVDEASEVINDPFIQILNKGRGAKFIVTAATQTLSDYIRRCGSEDAAYQVLGNFNNWICLRVVDTKTQKYFAEALPKTKVKYIMRTQGSSSATLLEFKGNSGERLMEEEAEMFPGAMLGKLPDLEFVASFGGGKLWKGRLPRLESH